MTNLIDTNTCLSAINACTFFKNARIVMGINKGSEYPFVRGQCSAQDLCSTGDCNGLISVC